MEFIERQIAKAVEERLSDKSSDEKLALWNNIKDQLSKGGKLHGVIYYKAYYGVWLDVGFEFPALLRIVDMIDLDFKKYVENETYQIGDGVGLSFIGMSDKPDKIIVAERNQSN